MKKLFALLLIVSLCIPMFAFAEGELAIMPYVDLLFWQQQIDAALEGNFHRSRMGEFALDWPSGFYFVDQQDTDDGVMARYSLKCDGKDYAMMAIWIEIIPDGRSEKKWIDKMLKDNASTTIGDPYRYEVDGHYASFSVCKSDGAYFYEVIATGQSSYLYAMVVPLDGAADEELLTKGMMIAKTVRCVSGEMPDISMLSNMSTSQLQDIKERVADEIAYRQSAGFR